ncbi:MAG: LysE family translocator [Flavobacteriales bacterium]
MSPEYFIKGIVLGISVAAPVGPIGVLCIKRSLTEGRLSGLITGLGAATADTLYGAIAAFGISFITDFLIAQQFYIRIVGGALLMVMGLRLYLSKVKTDVEMERGNLWHHFMSTMLLTITNPATIFFFIAAFAGLGLKTGPGNVGLSCMLVGGVAFGASLWWLSLSYIVGIWNNKIQITKLNGLNKISASVIIIFGMAAVLSVIFW